MLGELGDPFGQHLGQRAARVVLEMPFGGDDIGHEPVALRRIWDRLAVDQPQIPLDQNPADIEHDCFNCANRQFPALQKV